MTSKFHFIPETWGLSDDLRAWTKAKGLSDKQIDELREGIGDHQYRRAMMRPDACWRNWVKNAIKWEHVTPTVHKEYKPREEISPEQRKKDAAAAVAQMANYRRTR